MVDLSNYEELQEYFESLTDKERQDLASKCCKNCGGSGIMTAEHPNGREGEFYCECLVDGLIKKGEE